MACDERDLQAAQAIVRERRGGGHGEDGAPAQAQANAQAKGKGSPAKLVGRKKPPRPRGQRVAPAAESEAAAKVFRGVPLFSIPGVRVVLKTEGGSVVPYKPMFLSKQQLDKAWGLARKILSQPLLAKRKLERQQALAQVVRAAVRAAGLNVPSGGAGASGHGAGSDAEEEADEGDSTAGLGDPPEIKEFLEELGNGKGGPEMAPGGGGLSGGRGLPPMGPFQALARVCSSIACR